MDAALDIQTAVDEIEVAGFRPRMRAGVHWGCPRKLGGDYLGVDVNVAARVAEAAKAGEVFVSDAVAERIDTVADRALEAPARRRAAAQTAPPARVAPALKAPASRSRRRFLPLQD